MESHSKLQSFAQRGLPLVLGVYILLQPLLDALTSWGANAGHSVTAGVLVRTLFMALGFLYVVFVSRFDGKKWCLAAMGALLAYLALFLLYMFSLGGLALCLSNIKELVKTFFAPFVLIFLYAVYKQYGHLISTRTVAVTGGIYAGVILFAFLTGTSNTSYVNSGYGYNGWFFAANEISCIIAITGPITLYYCIKQLPSVTRQTWWKGLLIALAMLSIAFSANFIGTKIVFGVTLLYCLAAFIWLLVRYLREKGRDGARRTAVMGAMCVLLIGLYFVSPLQGYFNNIFMPLLNNEPDISLVSWGEEINKASEGTWLRALVNENQVVKHLDQILSRRLLSASPSVQVFTEGGLPAKLLGIGYADVPAYGRSVEFMIEMDPLGVLIRHGILGFLLYIVPYFAAVIWVIVQFFKRPAQRLASLEYCSYLYSVLIAFAIAVIAGHALVSPAVSTFVLVTGLTLWVMTRRQNQEPLTH